MAPKDQPPRRRPPERTARRRPASAEEPEESQRPRRRPAPPAKRQKPKKERQKKERKPLPRGVVYALIGVFVTVLFAALLIFLVIKDTESHAQATDEANTETTSLRSQAAPSTTIHLRAVGDLNITNATVNAGLAASGYDFTRAFQDVAPLLTEADCTVVNLEGNICGEPYGTEIASAPSQLLTALRSAGVDLIQTANSYSIYNGLIGLSSTLNAIRNAGMTPVGAYASNADFQTANGYTICDINGIRVAFVAFTKGLGGMGLPSGSENCVNLLYRDYDDSYKSVDTEKISTILKGVAAEKPDLIVALLHWGSEGSDEISKTQQSIVSLLQKKGVDVIIGTHPHLVHKVEFDKSAGTLIAYSLGDFFGNAATGGSDYSIVLDIEITKDNELGITNVTDFSYTPIYTLSESQCDGYRRVVRIKEAMDAYDANYVDKITTACYSQMAYALTRINARIKGE